MARVGREADARSINTVAVLVDQRGDNGFPHPCPGWCMGTGSLSPFWPCFVPCPVSVPPYRVPGFARNAFFGGSVWASRGETTGSNAWQQHRRPGWLKFAFRWPAPTNRGAGRAPQRGRAQSRGVIKQQHETGSLYGRSRRPCFGQYAHIVHADTELVRVGHIGQLFNICLYDFNSGSLPTARLEIKRCGSPCYSVFSFFFSVVCFGSSRGLLTTPWCDAAGERHNAAYRSFPTDSDRSPSPVTTWLSDPSRTEGGGL